MSVRYGAGVREGSAAPSGHVIVCGLEGVGLRTVEQLHLSGIEVVVLDDHPDQRLASVVRGWGVRHVPRSAHLGDGLVEAGLARAQAVVCVEHDEIRTLETALRVWELAPDMRVVVHLRNPSVAEALSRVSTSGTVLDVAALAAPAFLDACLGRTTHELAFEGTQFCVVQTTLPEAAAPASFRNQFDNLVPVAAVPAEGGPSVVCPGRDHMVRPGDRVALFGTRTDFHNVGQDVPPVGHSGGDRSSLRSRASRLRIALHDLDRSFISAVLGVALLVVISAFIIHLAYRATPAGGHLSVLSSVYFMTETMASVGFGDYTFAHQAAWMQLFGILVIVVGVGLVSTSFALFTNVLVARRLDQSLGRRRVTGMSGHIVVVGLGSIGIRVVEGLIAEGKQVVVVEQDERNRYLARVRALGVPVVVADGTQRQTHEMVCLADAAGVAVLTSSDLANIDAGLAVRATLGDKWARVPVVLRVFDRNLASMMETIFGFRHVRSTSALAAPWFAGAALGLDVLSSFYVDQQPFLVGRMEVTEDSGLGGLAMIEIGARIRVVAILRSGPEGTFEQPPRRDTRLFVGDVLYVLGPYEELLAVLRRDARPAPPVGR